MKKNLLSIKLTVLFLLFSAFAHSIFAIDYKIKFRFSDEQSTLNKVIVSNITQGTEVNIPAGTILNLIDSSNPSNRVNGSRNELKVFRNSMSGENTITFYAVQTGKALISVFRDNGSKVITETKNLEQGNNSFQLSLPIGFYIVSVSGTDYKYTSKIISNINASSIPSMAFLGAVPAQYTSSNESNLVSFNYSAGDVLIYNGISGTNTSVQTDIPTSDKTIVFDITEDIESHTTMSKVAPADKYDAVVIGTQTWMAKNLNVTKYRNGDEIKHKIKGKTYYDYKAPNKDANSIGEIGYMYNFEAVKDTRGLAPKGWHIPTIQEWETLNTYLMSNRYNYDNSISGNKIAKSLAANSGWSVSRIIGAVGNDLSLNNKSGFNALPGGWFDGNMYLDRYNSTTWWTKDPCYNNFIDINTQYGCVSLVADSANLIIGCSNLQSSRYIRCIKDKLPVISKQFLSVIDESNLKITCTFNVSGNQDGESISTYAICSTSPTPVDDTVQQDPFAYKNISTKKTGEFKIEISKLEAGVKYYIRVYAINDAGVVYSEEKTFMLRLKDVDGNIYKTIKIGTQVWMVENLRTTRYRNGSNISKIVDDKKWSNISSGAYCDYYENDAINKKRGKLYNWHAVNSSAGLAPKGWHVPSAKDWNILKEYLVINGYNYDGSTIIDTSNPSSDNKLAQSMAANTDWRVPESTSPSSGNPGFSLLLNNRSGFSALPYVVRKSSGEYYKDDNTCTKWWTSDANKAGAIFRIIYYNLPYLITDTDSKNSGLYIRCVKD
ncbi:MAG: hypothetical protein JZU53_01505 [Paludibacter sp.]|nr:hypothetical protein [Paludibacter sp.]